jgi:hypothetical protein
MYCYTDRSSGNDIQYWTVEGRNVGVLTMIQPSLEGSAKCAKESRWKLKACNVPGAFQRQDWQTNDKPRTSMSKNKTLTSYIYKWSLLCRPAGLVMLQLDADRAISG